MAMARTITMLATVANTRGNNGVDKIAPHPSVVAVVMPTAVCAKRRRRHERCRLCRWRRGRRQWSVTGIASVGRSRADQECRGALVLFVDSTSCSHNTVKPVVTPHTTWHSHRNLTTERCWHCVRLTENISKRFVVPTSCLKCSWPVPLSNRFCFWLIRCFSLRQSVRCCRSESSAC